MVLAGQVEDGDESVVSLVGLGPLEGVLGQGGVALLEGTQPQVQPQGGVVVRGQGEHLKSLAFEGDEATWSR